MNRYIVVKKQTLAYMLVISLIFALFVTSLFYIGYRTFSKLEKEVYANNELEVASVEIVEERVVPVFKEVVVEVVKEPVSMKKIGTFYLTAYCPCSVCCEQWAAPPAGKVCSIGVGAYEGITFAVDPKVIPYGTKIYIDGVGVGIAADCGGGIKGNRIDVYFTDHNEARQFGRGGGKGFSVYRLE